MEHIYVGETHFEFISDIISEMYLLYFVFIYAVVKCSDSSLEFWFIDFDGFEDQSCSFPDENFR